MAILIDRHKNKASIMGIDVEVPENRSVLSLFAGNNSFNEGEQYNDDGYVYKNGCRLRKWFSNREGWNHFWHPVVVQLARIEAAYYKSLCRFNKKHDRINQLVQSIVSSGTAKAHFYDEKSRQWGVFKIGDSVYGRTYSLNWLKNKPNRILNRDLGQELYRLDFSSNNIVFRLSNLLNEAILKELQKTKPTVKDIDKVFDISINGRKYLYRCKPMNYPPFEKIAWPMDNIEHISVCENRLVSIEGCPKCKKRIGAFCADCGRSRGTYVVSTQR